MIPLKIRGNFGRGLIVGIQECIGHQAYVVYHLDYHKDASNTDFLKWQAKHNKVNNGHVTDLGLLKYP